MVPPSRRSLVAGLVAALCGCTQPAPEGSNVGRLEGRVQLTGAQRGDAYLFLFPPGEGVAEVRPVPRYVTAVPDLRLSAGDGRFVFSSVEAGEWRLWGFVDANGDADLTVDVLAQPGAGDLVAADFQPVEVQARQRAQVELRLERRLQRALPAFRVEGLGAGTEVVWPDVLQGLLTLTVRSDALGVLGGEPPRFTVRLVDENGDGVGDDLDGDGLPDLVPRFFLRWRPRPGQGAEVGQGEVLVPLLFNPAPFLAVLQGQVGQEVLAESLQLIYLPRALSVREDPERGRVVTTLGAVPPGEYELWALTDEGGAWWVPNGLAKRNVEPVASQGVRVRVVRSTAADGGTGGP